MSKRKKKTISIKNPEEVHNPQIQTEENDGTATVCLIDDVLEARYTQNTILQQCQIIIHAEVC